MSKKEIGLLIPVHPPKYSHIKEILESYDNSYDYELIFIFTNFIDKNIAYKIYSKLNEHKNLILEEMYPDIKFLNLSNIVFAKKFAALNYFKDFSYEYFIILDVEIKFIHNKNIKPILDDIYDKKFILGSICGHTSYIMSKSKNLFSQENQKKLDSIIPKDLYTWWSDIPFIKKSDIDDFFTKINFSLTQSYLQNIVWDHFDHIIYQYYLILYKKFSIHKLVNKGFGIENYDSNDFITSNRIPNICAMKYYNDNKVFENIWYIYHCDRM